MNVTSVNIGRPKDVAWRTRTVTTGIFKAPVDGPVTVRRNNLDGDGQADLKHHGGADKAVYAYPADHYAWWSQHLGRDDLVPGQFGENLTVAGLDEAAVCIGDRLDIGTASFTVTQPRVPCFKLGVRFDDENMPKRFVEARRPGMYLRVDAEGTLAAGDVVTCHETGAGRHTVRDVFSAWFAPKDANALKTLRGVLDEPALSDDWREQIVARLDR